MVGFRVTADPDGPLFDERAPAIVQRYTDQVQREVAAQGYADTMRFLNASIRQPTPYYETQITVERRAADLVVHDRGIVYGPWLEGVSERNRSTRFKGYFSFRRGYQATDARVPTLAEHVARRELGALG